MPLTKLTRRDAELMHQTLSFLSKKTLPNLPADLRVARALRALRPAMIEHQAGLNGLNSRHALPDNPDGKVKEPAAYQIELEAFRNEEVEVDLPAPLAKDMLPIELSTKPDNRTALAEIIFGLGPMFEIPSDA